MSHLDFAIKVDKVSVVTTKNYETEIHAQGCAHEAKALDVSVRSKLPTSDDGYDDDWYHVAPCARKSPRKN